MSKAITIYDFEDQYLTKNDNENSIPLGSYNYNFNTGTSIDSFKNSGIFTSIFVGGGNRNMRIREEFINFLQNVDNFDILPTVPEFIHEETLDIGNTLLDKEIENFLDITSNKFREHPQRVVTKLTVTGNIHYLYKLLSAINDEDEYEVYLKTEDEKNIIYILHIVNYVYFIEIINPLLKRTDTIFDVVKFFNDIDRNDINKFPIDDTTKSHLITLYDKINFAYELYNKIINSFATLDKIAYVLTYIDEDNNNKHLTEMFTSDSTININRNSFRLWDDDKYIEKITVPSRKNNEDITVDIDDNWVLDYFIRLLISTENLSYTMDTVITDTMSRGKIGTPVIKITMRGQV